MKLLHGFGDPAAYRGGIVAIGNFDGVHRGHQRMIAELVRQSREQGAPAVVFTFDPHPIELLRPDHTVPNLNTLERKAELLAEHGVACVIAYPTDWALLKRTPEEFFQTIVQQELDAKGLVEGPNFFFGRDRAGDIATLQRLCEAAGITLTVVPPVEVGGRIVSSSSIRSLIQQGGISDAVALLGHPYRIRGRVVRGADRGAALGFPTANLERVATLIPGNGVYAGRTTVDDHCLPAAIHVGPNPTFDDQQRKVEVHLVGFSGDLYGRELDVDFLKRLRAVSRFESVEALRQQLQRDVETVKGIVGER